MSRARIIATLGPASSDESTIEQMIEAGVNVFRLNYSHGSPDEKTELYRRTSGVLRTRGVRSASSQMPPDRRYGSGPSTGRGS